MSSLLPVLPALASLTRGDLFFVTEDPGGTPADKKINIEILFGNLPKLDDIDFQSEVNSIVFLQVLDTAGAIVLNVDTVNKRIGIGTAAGTVPLHVVLGGTPVSITTATSAIFQNNAAVGDTNVVSIVSGNTGNGQLVFRDVDDEFIGRLLYDHSANTLRFFANNINGLSLLAAGDVGIGSLADPTAGGGKVLFFGDNAGDPTMAANTAGFYGKDVSGTVEAFAVDEAGNAAQLTSHPQDAPSAFYLAADELPPYIQKSFNLYIGKIEWFRADISLKQYETFNAYNLRRSLATGHVEFMVQYDWTEQQQVQVDRSESARTAWEAGDQSESEPEIYIAQEPPQSLKDRGITLKN